MGSPLPFHGYNSGGNDENRMDVAVAGADMAHLHSKHADCAEDGDCDEVDSRDLRCSYPCYAAVDLRQLKQG